MEDFEQLVTNQPTQTPEESLEYGEIDAALNFQPLTESEMIQQSKLALEAYRRKGSWGIISDLPNMILFNLCKNNIQLLTS